MKWQPFCQGVFSHLPYFDQLYNAGTWHQQSCSMHPAACADAALAGFIQLRVWFDVQTAMFKNATFLRGGRLEPRNSSGCSCCVVPVTWQLPPFAAPRLHGYCWASIGSTKSRFDIDQHCPRIRFQNYLLFLEMWWCDTLYYSSGHILRTS